MLIEYYRPSVIHLFAAKQPRLAPTVFQQDPGVLDTAGAIAWPLWEWIGTAASWKACDNPQLFWCGGRRIHCCTQFCALIVSAEQNGLLDLQHYFTALRIRYTRHVYKFGSFVLI
jgi:hypothetical protein